MNIPEIINKVLSTDNSAFFYTPPIYGESYSYLFLKPEKIITIKSLSQIDKKLNRADELIKNGLTGYSIIEYEAGYLFEATLNKFLPEKKKLLRFFFFNNNNMIRIDSKTIDLDCRENYKIKHFRLNTDKKNYEKAIKKIKFYISEGDTYQVNYTVKGRFEFTGSVASFFTSLLFNQSARYTAIINNHPNLIISCSPEMFFEIKRTLIKSMPMKGTIKRGINPVDDKLLFKKLKQSEKNKAENVMIVDMIRNDLGRISRYGSVKVDNLFEIEKYESVYQMISTVNSKMNKKVKLSGVLRNIFPCASITGAPKIRTMEIIRELEKERRGIYTGSIGLITKDKITFNVAIRTVVLNNNCKSGSIGLGSGIVWDSIASEEYEETILKGRFLTSPNKKFQLIETMLVENKNIFLLKDHLERLRISADYFLFNFDESKILKQLNSITSRLDQKKYKLRMTLNKYGSLELSVSEIAPEKKLIKVIVSDKRINSQDKFQYFKTTNRKIYDSEFKKYSKSGYYDVLFLNEKNEIAEGSISNVFIKKKGKIYTPPVSSGILNGVYRNYFLKKKPAIKEKPLFLSDLLNAERIILTNSVRKEIIVQKLILV